MDYAVAVEFGTGDDDGDDADNAYDFCPDLFDPAQLDSDGDGVGNACDGDCVEACTDNSEGGPCEEQFTADNGHVVVLRSHDLAEVDACIERVIISIHGSGRNANTGFASLTDSAADHGVGESTLVIAPRFRVPGHDPDEYDCDPIVGTCVDGRHYWTSAGWMQGGDGWVYTAQPIAEPGISSFSFIDSLIAHVVDSGNFPNLKTVVLTGHSAGAQFTQRYAVGGLAPRTRGHMDFQFVPANAGSYMLMSPAGLDPTISPALWPSLLTYKHGLFGRLGTPYMTTLGLQSTHQRSLNPYVDQYLEREVTYLIGAEDHCSCAHVHPDGTPCDAYMDLDGDGKTNSVPCRDADKAQGPHRLWRAYNMLDSLDVQYGASNHNHALLEIPGVNHSNYDVLSCGDAPSVLLGVPTVVNPAECP